ncbi:SMP-30/gluconolactonase/LRE family protein [Sphingomonas mucosissima]|uniref:Gluconolactonase n=1 Tax=Sphingomonas mucosissima TaxID=370959 RepID=A0A245ZL83_9SPHN|nr:SMP-30/gluconolactonase/LRE family protein [Sphingomonas mucosissima]OWK30511.1 gluconolactonase precursor [Sphingomonas mucosissima]
MIARRSLLAGLAATAFAAQLRAEPVRAGVTRLDPELDGILDVRAVPEVLGRGYRWAEGPVWVPRGNYLLFSDVPANTVYRWSRARGVERFLHPSGLQGPVPVGVREAGANGLALDASGRLLIADSGTRAVVRVDLATRKRTVLAGRFEGKRFNSVNDLVVATDGAIYFTDPPYGLEGGDASPLREQAVNGVYRRAPDGRITLVDGSHKRPNGIGLSPDGRTLYLSLSDEARPEVLAYALDTAGMPTPSRVFHDMRPHFARGWPGLPDGMDVAPSGYLFATGPGGVHVLAPDGRLLGIVSTGKVVANACIGEGGRSLFLTSSDELCRIGLRG